MSDEAQQPPEGSVPEPAANTLPPGHVFDTATGQPRPMTFMERARQAAGTAAVAAAKVSVDVGSQAAKAGADLGGRAAAATAATIKDPATKARARAALKKAKRGFTTALERIDPRILADVVVKATSLQEKANASLKDRGSAYRIGEITIGASIPPSIQFAIERVDDPENVLLDSRTLLEKSANTSDQAAPIEAETIVTLDGTAVAEADLDELEDEE
ncbi:MAG TPA: hypothetical protein VMQ65_01610 [Candidatus Limnocylindria bacterium]|nr:hypothetical protein [Candidatus Limnocylindria bacterium]